MAGFHFLLVCIHPDLHFFGPALARAFISALNGQQMFHHLIHFCIVTVQSNPIQSNPIQSSSVQHLWYQLSHDWQDTGFGLIIEFVGYWLLIFTNNYIAYLLFWFSGVFSLFHLLLLYEAWQLNNQQLTILVNWHVVCTWVHDLLLLYWAGDWFCPHSQRVRLRSSVSHAWSLVR
jgi:hypothetical protein